jgi:hypothetical protein
VKNNNIYRVVPFGMLAFSLNALAAEGCPTAADEIPRSVAAQDVSRRRET